MEDISRKKGKVNQGRLEGGDEPWETVDSEKQTEGFGGDGGGGLGEPGCGF